MRHFSLANLMARETMADKLDGFQVGTTEKSEDNGRNMSAWKALSIYWKAAAWTMFLSLCIVMRAYDIETVGNFFAVPSFQQRYGTLVEGSHYQIPAAWQVALSVSSLVGQIFGSILVVYPMEWFGCRYTLPMCLLLTIILIVLQFIVPSIELLTLSEYMSGFIWGSYCVLIATFASEVLPTPIRGLFTGYINSCYVFGRFISTGITTGFDTRQDLYGFIIPYAVQIGWPLIIVAGLYFLPESPWWFVRRGRVVDAEKSLRRLCNANSPRVDTSKAVELMMQTGILEQELESGVGFVDCFLGTSRRRTEICMMVFFIRNVSGPLSQITTPPAIDSRGSPAFPSAAGFNVTGVVGTCLAIIPLMYFGRRRLYLTAMSFFLPCLLVLAMLAVAQEIYVDQSYHAQRAVFLAILDFIWQVSLGPLSYVITCEIPSTRLRSRTISIAIMFDGLTGLLTTVIAPYLLCANGLKDSKKVEFASAGVILAAFAWCFLRLPESKDRTFQQLDLMFEEGVGTMEFAEYKFDAED